MSSLLRPTLVLAAVFALAGCGGGDDDGRSAADPAAGLNVTANTSAPANVVEAAPTAVPVPAPLSAEERRAAVRNVRDGPGEERGPEYEGARSAATALPPHGDDATTTDAVPPPPPPSPGTPQNLVVER